MNTKPSSQFRRYQIALAILGAICAGAIVLNLEARQAPVHDAAAVTDVNDISGSVQSYYADQNSLPANLTDLTDLPAPTQKRLKNYEYTRTGLYNYQICATFLAPSKNTPNEPTPQLYRIGGTDPGVHTKGRECFQYTVDYVGTLQPGQAMPNVQ